MGLLSATKFTKILKWIVHNPTTNGLIFIFVSEVTSFNGRPKNVQCSKRGEAWLECPAENIEWEGKKKYLH